MKKQALTIMTILLFTLSACAEDENNTEKIHIEELPAQKTMEFSYGNQNFQIIPFYEETLDYIEVVEGNTLLNTLGTFNYTVKSPLLEKMSEKKMILKREIPPNITITHDIQNLKDQTAELIQHQDATNELIKESLVKSADLLEGGDKTIYVMPVNPDMPTEDMGGLAAWTLDDNVILLALSSSYNEEMLAYTMAHEYHHAVTMEGDTAYDSLLDFVVFEGKGDAFAKTLYPETEVAWTKQLSDEEMEVAFAQLKESGNTTDFEIYEGWLDGNPEMNIPRWANYRMGDLIMQDYLKNHGDVTLEEWAELDAEDILQGGVYKGFLGDS
ncbi:DUF2268 domain-containing protein [Bacillus sp. Marseille-Q1617]|uniref:DUF2268 domain-containing protein n=1 Tax=Bacillus sp. Marseille-Q1617 TaxID=2736887 RepID=UPI001589D250|nr:DUF2268 domain-containing putative Zn-dependent protease [Bacillus sp. Marseille-Q1617]